MNVAPETHAATASSAEWIERDAHHNSGLWSPGLAIVAGRGCEVWDADGNRYLDMVAGIAVASLGHAHPALVDAISRQAATLTTCPQSYANDVRTEFLEALFRMTPAPLTRAFLCNSGAEANEAALKWARAATGKSTFVAAKRGFSGRTLGVLPLTWTPSYREPFEPLAYAARFVSFGDEAALRDAVRGDVAAILLEPIQGEGGMHPASKAFTQRARELADEHGALLIFDEVQSGAGRTGKFLAHEWLDVRADAVTMAKGLGGGVPIGALLMTDALAAAMPAGGHGTTFGGNPLAAAAGRAVLHALENGLMDHVRSVGDHFVARLHEVAASQPRIREVRGTGLMVGVEFKEKVAPILQAMQRRGVLAINAGSTVVRFVPPLIVTTDEIDRAVEALVSALDDTAPESDS